MIHQSFYQPYMNDEYLIIVFDIIYDEFSISLMSNLNRVMKDSLANDSVQSSALLIHVRVRNIERDAAHRGRNTARRREEQALSIFKIQIYKMKASYIVPTYNINDIISLHIISMI